MLSEAEDPDVILYAVVDIDLGIHFCLGLLPEKPGVSGDHQAFAAGIVDPRGFVNGRGALEYIVSH
jgi:hypothetical protein